MLPSKGLLLFLSSIVALVAAQPMRPIRVQGTSMSPTYADGETLWTTPVDRPLKRGEVVIADTPEGAVIKRVALVAGDRRLQWNQTCGWIDIAGLAVPRSAHARERLRNLVVPPGTVFLLGDNLDRSVDSRAFGPVRVENVRRLVIDQRSADDRSGVERPLAREWLAQGAGLAPRVRRDRAMRLVVRSWTQPTNL